MQHRFECNHHPASETFFAVPHQRVPVMAGQYGAVSRTGHFVTNATSSFEAVHSGSCI